MQNLGEMGIEFIQQPDPAADDGQARRRFLPFLVSIFFFVWIMNLMEIIPVAQFPAMSLIAFPAALMLMVYGTYTYLGIKHQGLGGYFANMIPKDVPLFILGHPGAGRDPAVRPHPAVHPGRPALREHVRRATSCSWCSRSPPGTCSAPRIGLLFSATSFILVIVLTAFEMLIQVLQAYIFTILTAQYIGGSLEAGH